MIRSQLCKFSSAIALTLLQAVPAPVESLLLVSTKQRETANNSELFAIISLLFFVERTRKARISAAKARVGRCKFGEKQQKQRALSSEE
jgi:hypothetical protein